MRIQNNYIGYNSIISIDGGERLTLGVSNNNILNDCSISIYPTIATQFNNNIIKNHNIINVSNNGFNHPNIFKYNNIENNNIIIKNGESLTNTIINSSNNITLYNNASNVTILNNCDGSINLSDNIIVDNYIDTAANSSLNTTPNSVYLFGQDVYAKSFNTLK